jgi:hypothetical protein
VPKRFVVPRVSAKDFQNQQQKVSFPFEDENNAVTHLGGLNRKEISKVVAIHGVQGAFFKYVDKILAFFNHLPPYVDNFYLLRVAKKSIFWDYLPTSSCQRSL